MFIAFRKKSDVFNTFKKCKALVENQTRNKLSVLDQIMEVNTAARSLITTVHTMGFVDRRQFQEHHKKMVCQKE